MDFAKPHYYCHVLMEPDVYPGTSIDIIGKKYRTLGCQSAFRFARLVFHVQTVLQTLLSENAEKTPKASHVMTNHNLTMKPKLPVLVEARASQDDFA